MAKGVMEPLLFLLGSTLSTGKINLPPCQCFLTHWPVCQLLPQTSHYLIMVFKSPASMVTSTFMCYDFYTYWKTKGVFFTS